MSDKNETENKTERASCKKNSFLDIGTTLRRYRDEAELSLDQLCDKTKIPRRKIEQLEQGGLDNVDAPVFVRGYIRSYAKAVNAEADELIKAYDDSLTTSVTEVEDTAADPAPTKTSKRLLLIDEGISRSKLPFVLASIAAISLSLAIWFVYDRFGAADSGSAVESSSSTLLSVPDEKPASKQFEVDGSVLTSKIETNEARDYQNAASLTAPDQGVSTSQSIQAQVSSKLTSPLSKSNVPAATGENLLEFFFSEECWVEVTDVTDTVIFADLQDSGDNLRLFGSAPFNIMLGNARAVDLSIDGKPVEIEVASSRKTLRINVLAAK